MEIKDKVNKHAYLIIAHTNFRQLQELICLLDDKRNDIYIHIDKKVKNFRYNLVTKYSSLFYSKRLNVKWGTVSQIEVEYCLFEKAVSHQRYDYYHLISGQDLPLHNQNYIHHFFSQFNGKEFIGYGNGKWDVVQRVYCHNYFLNQMRNPFLLFRYFFKIMRLLLNYIQINFHIHPDSDGNYFKYGCNWVSITHDFLIDLISNKDEILVRYKYAYCPDEIYKQTFAFHSDYKNRLYNIKDEFIGCMREIDWKRGCPYVYKTDDYQMLINSNKLFARKFDEQKDSEIIDKIKNHIENEKQ